MQNCPFTVRVIGRSLWVLDVPFVGLFISVLLYQSCLQALSPVNPPGSHKREGPAVGGGAPPVWVPCTVFDLLLVSAAHSSYWEYLSTMVRG